MPFFTCGKLAIVVFEDNSVAWRPRGQFFYHLVDFALVPLLGSILRDLEEVQDFLAFSGVAGFFGLFWLLSDSGWRPSTQRTCAPCVWPEPLCI